jgi:hypothetical protein
MALDFPSPPYDGQIYIDPTSGSKYIYEAATTKWKSIQHVGVVIAYGFDKANSAYLNSNVAFKHANVAYDTANAALPNVSNAVFNGNLRVTGNLLIGMNTVTIRDNHIISAEYYRMNTANHMVVIPDGNRVNALHTLANSAYDHANTKFSSSGGTINGSVEINADLTVHGNTKFVDQQSLVVGDPLLYLAANNYSSDLVDIGFVANYVNATSVNVHTGLFRSANTKEYYLFQGYDQEAYNNYIDPTGNNISMAILNSTLRTSNIILGQANAINWIRSSYNTANNIANGTITINNISLSGNINPGSVNIITQTLTDSANVSWNVAVAAVASVTLGGNRYIDTPTNLKVGTLILHINQDGTGGRSLTWSPIFKWPAGVAPVLSTTGNSKDIFSFICDGTYLYGSFLPDVR